MKTQLTAKQERLLRFIEQFTADNGYPPTMTEMAVHFQVVIGTIQDHLDALKRKGCLRHKPKKARGIELPYKPSAIPIYGRVAAGHPIFAAENIDGYWNEKDKEASDFFALRVVGDSMIEAGIVEGDILKVKKQKTAEDKDVVVALIGEEATVKRFRRRYGNVSLEPANPKYPVIKDIEFEIIGKVVELKRPVK